MDLAPSWTAEEWSALGDVLLGIGAVAAGVWTLINYRRTRRAEAAHWLQGVFRDFYLDDRFREIKLEMEYHYGDRLGPLLERRVTDAHVPVSADDKALLEQLDVLLNYFEHVIYLERERHLTTQDRQAVFEYWFDLMEAPDRAAIRRYAAWFGFERVALALKCQASDYIALYGSLRKQGEISDKPDLSEYLKPAGDAVIKGLLFDMGDYPALIPGDGAIQGEVYEVVDRKAFVVVDEFERYDPNDVDGSLYVRRAVRLTKPKLDAWVYIYNRRVGNAPRIASGDWIEHTAQRSSRHAGGPGPST
ncbi:MAG: gamma-glutamylcyclotransferase [Actinobacteria bacterium]|nr:gamma-glutamylcyclotransferase [Actinomycetota bacterium]